MDFTKRWIEQYLKQKVDVFIYYNNQNGSWVWSVTPVIDQGFWLNAFKKKKEAKKYCEEHGLKVTEIFGKGKRK